MSSDDVPADDLAGLSEAPPSTFDTVDNLLARVVAAPAEAPLPGEGARIGRYVLLTRLGAGAMGVVFAAYDPQLDRKVALKILRRAASGPAGTSARERAVREARALAKLVHPNIVAVHDGGLDGETLYVVMEFVDGVTLRAYLAERARSVDEILDAFRQAAQGLSAAHDVTLVHRDFKPDNVLVGKDGRVRVADFGLARLAGVADAEGTTSGSGPTPEPLTATGAFVGTLAFMAPEQMELGRIDPRADQFAFAVSLWSALYGNPPFSGDNLKARRAAIAAGPVVADGERRVPSWLLAILRRALAVRPDDRFATMRELIAAVERGRGRRRRFAAGVAALVAVGTIVPAVWFTRGEAAPEPCAGAGPEMAKVWTPARAAAIDTVFPDTTAGAAAANRLHARLDRYARSWVTAHRSACRATRVDRSQSEDLLDRRMVCLGRARARLDGVLTSIARVGSDQIVALVAAVDELPRLERCADLSALSALVPMPADAAARERVEAAAARFDGLVAAVQDRSGADKTAETGAALAQARAAGWLPLTAEAGWAHATALYNDAQPAASLVVYREAATTALAGGYDELATHAMADVAWGIAEARQSEEAQSWIELAQAMLARPGVDVPLVRLHVITTASEVARQLGDAATAVVRAEEAVALARGSTAELAEDALGKAHSNLALALVALGRHDEAIASYDAAIEEGRRVLGGDYPSIASRIHGRGWALFEMGRTAEALSALEQALAIRERWFGPDAMPVADSYQAIGGIHGQLGNIEPALAAFERALTIVVAHPGVDPTRAIELEGNVAMIESIAGRYEAAAIRGLRVLVAMEALAGPESPQLVNVLLQVGFAERGRGRLDEAARHMERAVMIAENAFGAASPAAANPRIELGNTEVARGRLRDAIALFERVIADGAADPSVDRSSVAEASLALAGALVADDRAALPRARTLAAEARDLYATLGESYVAQRDAAVAWLAAHR